MHNKNYKLEKSNNLQFRTDQGSTKNDKMEVYLAIRATVHALIPFTSFYSQRRLVCPYRLNIFFMLPVMMRQVVKQMETVPKNYCALTRSRKQTEERSIVKPADLCTSISYNTGCQKEYGHVSATDVALCELRVFAYFNGLLMHEG
jgi:hypothetical protein